MSRSQASASYAVDDPGGSMDDLGGGNTNYLGSYSSLATFTTTSPKTSASFVSSSLTTRMEWGVMCATTTATVGGDQELRGGFEQGFERQLINGRVAFER